MSHAIEPKELLLAEYEYFTDSIWKNEEVGEKRVEFFITLATAVMAAVITLVTSKRTNLAKSDIQQISTAALFSILLLGLITYLKMLKRNEVTKEYRKIVDFVREKLAQMSNLSGYKPPFQEHKHIFQGGLAETVGMMNSLILAALVAIWVGKGPGWILVIAVFIVGFISFILAANRKAPVQEETFRASVGALILNGQDKVLAVERHDLRGAWQLPQGGRKIGEQPLESIQREIKEEIGIEKEKLKVIVEVPGLFAYELPEAFQKKKTGLGQVQRWYVFRFMGTDKKDIKVDKNEIKNYEWTTMDILISRAISFRIQIYKDLRSFLKEKIKLKI